MLSELKYAVQILALAMILYRVIHCQSSFDKEAMISMSKYGVLPQKPLRCYGTDNVLDAKCCIIPPFFSREIAEQCGTKGAIRFEVPGQNVTGFARIGLSCESWTCILSMYHLLVDDMLDDRRFNMHLQRWVKLNPEFKEIISSAKSFCRRIYLLQFPMDPCNYERYHYCYRNYIKLDCPLSVNSTVCDEQKKFYDECRDYFLKK